MKYDMVIQSNFSPFNIGGIETVASNTAGLFPNKKICHFFGARQNVTTTAENKTYIGLRILCSVAGLNFLLFGNMRLILLSFQSRLLIFNDPYPTLWLALFFLKLFRRNILVIYHADPKVPKGLEKTYFALRNWLYRGQSLVVSSPQLMSSFPDNMHNQIKVIPWWLDESNETEKPQQKLPLRYYLYIGRLASYKGIYELLETCRMSNHLNFVIVGEGPDQDLVEEYIQNFKLKNITLIDTFVSTAQKNHLIKNCRGLLFPSTNSGEAFGIVQLEAMYFGKPILNTNLGTGVNFVGQDNVNALTSAPRDIAAFTSNLHKLHDNDALHQKLSSNSKGLYKKQFSPEISKNKLRNAINELL